MSDNPINERIKLMWATVREIVIAALPTAPNLSSNAFIDYEADAFHSLAIEGYKVSPEMIARTAGENWKGVCSEITPCYDELAARGYWLAFQAANKFINECAVGNLSEASIRVLHHGWCRELFRPQIDAGIYPVASFIGYRNHSVRLQNSRYTPPRAEAVSGAMKTLFDLLETEQHAGVRAVLGHWLIGYIHPYPDGNGRTARFLMNVMFVLGGYPWTIIPIEERDRYLRSLDSASVDGDIEPFANLISERISIALERCQTPNVRNQHLTN